MDNKKNQKYTDDVAQIIENDAEAMGTGADISRPDRDNVIDGYIPLVNLDYICSVKKDGEIVAFGVMVPSIARALKRSQGRLLPFGLVRMLKALRGKNDTLEMYFVAVDPKYQLQGVPAILITTLLEKLIKNGVKFCETGPMLETNGAVHSLWAYFDKRQHKRRRCFIKEI